MRKTRGKSEPNLFGVEPKPKREKAPAVPGGAVQRLISLWIGLFEKRFKEKPVITARDGAALKRLVSHAGAEAVERRLPRYLELDDPYIANEGYPLALLQRSWNKLIVADRRDNSTRTPDADRTAEYLRKLRHK